MKVVAFNGSPRKGGNTSQMIQIVLKELEHEGIQTELVEMAGNHLYGCKACYACKDKQDQKCIIQNDLCNEYIAKMVEADGIILGSPTYFSNVSSEMKALIDRAGIVGRANGDMFKRKIGAAVVAVRRAGAVNTFNSINHFFFIEQMIVPGSIYWNLGIGRAPGEVLEDEEGVETMKVLGKNMAWLLKAVQRENEKTER
ncbi:MAG: flavodoxin family protein [Candidatus Omnitrophota bacterium]